MKLFLDEQAANLKLEALTQDVSSVKQATTTAGGSAHSRTLKPKGIATSTSSESLLGNYIILKFTKLDILKFNG